jgi:hypothetical protein
MRDLLLVLAAALLLRSCEPSRGVEAAARIPQTPPAAQLEPASASVAAGEWRRRDVDDRPVLLFGESGAPPLAAISCDRDALLVERMTVTPSGGIGSMTVTADNRTRTLPVMSDGAGLPNAGVSLKLGDRMVESLGRGSGRIELDLGDEPRLVLPADRQIGALVDECRG